MLYHLLYPLRDIFFGFNVFKYITFRAAAAAVSAFLISLLIGPSLIKRISNLKIKEVVRPEQSCPSIYRFHQQKQGTPTMGGILILASIFSANLLWADIFNKYVLFTLAGTLWLGILGFIDDYLKLKDTKRRGLAKTSKLLGQIFLGLIIGIILYIDPEVTTRLDIPFFKKLVVDLGIFYILFAILVVVGSSNAVNLTDGLDGLACGCMIMVAISYSLLSYVSGHIDFSRYLLIPYIRGAGELTVFCASIVGSGLGFLWFNSYPASVFMGDVGSLALGGAIGLVALFIKKELLLGIVGGVFVLEALSVILQVGYFRWRGKRLFKVAPLHHHFQVLGLHESKIIVRFWIISSILALLTLTTLKLR